MVISPPQKKKKLQYNLITLKVSSVPPQLEAMDWRHELAPKDIQIQQNTQRNIRLPFPPNRYCCYQTLSRNRTTSRCPFWAAMDKGIIPLSVRPWFMLASDSTRNRTTSRCPFSAAMKRGVAPLFVVPWSLMAPDSTRNWTTSRCPRRAAMKRGVAPLFVVHWSVLAPDSTRNRTTSRCPFWAAMKTGVAPQSVLPWSLLAPD